MGRRRVDRCGMDLRGNPEHEATGKAPIGLDPLFRAHLQEHLEGGGTLPFQFGQALPVEVGSPVQSQELPTEFADLRIEKDARLVLAEVHRVVHVHDYDSTLCNQFPPAWNRAGQPSTSSRYLPAGTVTASISDFGVEWRAASGSLVVGSSHRASSSPKRMAEFVSSTFQVLTSAVSHLSFYVSIGAPTRLSNFPQ